MRHSMTILAAAAATTLAACSSTNSGNGSAGTVGLNLATTPVARTAAMVAGPGVSLAPETIADGTNTLIIDSAAVVLRKIELQSADTTQGACNPNDDSASSSDDCEEIKLDPILLDLPLGGTTAERKFSVEIPAGTYKEFEFKIHKLTGSSRDAALLAQHPEFANASIRLKGTFNGTPFTFLSDVEAEYEQELNPPLVIAAAGATDLTINVDLDSWFRTNGTTLINPATANKGQPNESIVANRIKASFKGFEDKNRDGRED